MQKGNLSRRGFMQRSLTALAAAGLPTWYAKEVFGIQAAQEAKQAAQGDRLLMGAIGLGPRPRRCLDLYNAARQNKSVVFTAACNVDKSHLDYSLNLMKENGFTSVKGYKDYRELLDNKDIQAVAIAVPDHWHALIAIDALRKGKDIYLEKPMTLTVAEGQALVKVTAVSARSNSSRPASAASTRRPSGRSRRSRCPKDSIGTSGWGRRRRWTTSPSAATTSSAGGTTTPAAR
jgi:hypothetical protein